MESNHSAGELLNLAREVLEDAGAPPATAVTVAESLVESNLRGHDSHGVRRLVPIPPASSSEGRIDPAAEPDGAAAPRRAPSSSTVTAASARSRPDWR